MVKVVFFTNKFFMNTQSRFATVVLGGVVGSLPIIDLPSRQSMSFYIKSEQTKIEIVGRPVEFLATNVLSSIPPFPTIRVMG